MFLDNENQIPAKKVTGTIILPQKVSNINNIKVWGHGDLNGKITVASEDTINFKVKNLRSYKMFEIRVAITDKIIDVQSENRFRKHDLLPVAMKEENKWANEINSNNEKQKKIILELAIVYILLLIYNVIRLIKAYIISKENKQNVNNIQYIRDIPREENITPGEAAYLYYFDKSEFNTKKYQSNIVAGTILDLCFKKHISLRNEQEKIYVKILTDGENLKNDELIIFEMLKKCEKEDEEFEISELNEYAKTNYNEYANTINKFINCVRDSLYDLKLVDKNKQRQYKKAEKAVDVQTLFEFLFESIIVLFILGFIPIVKSLYIRIFGIAYQTNFIELLLISIPLIIVILSRFNMIIKAKDRIAVLTITGLQEKEEWNALANYMKNFSNLEDKEVENLNLLEKYLVYATTLGIADKVVEQMKAKYPEIFVKEKLEL